MARPTDPIKLAAYLQRQARNAANYRARQKAARLGVPVPVQAIRQREANYRPPAVRGAVERAQATRAQQRAARNAVISSLPDIRNPQVRLRTGEVTDRGLPERKTKKGRERQAQAFRERAAAEKLQNVGRARQEQIRSELQHGSQSDRLRDAMDRGQQAEFQRLSDIIASGSRQSIAILFDHAGGQGEYSAAYERIVASPESRDVEQGLAMLATLADRARAAAVEYAPSRIGRLTV